MKGLRPIVLSEHLLHVFKTESTIGDALRSDAVLLDGDPDRIDIETLFKSRKELPQKGEIDLADLQGLKRRVLLPCPDLDAHRFHFIEIVPDRIGGPFLHRHTMSLLHVTKGRPYQGAPSDRIAVDVDVAFHPLQLFREDL